MTLKHTIITAVFLSIILILFLPVLTENLNLQILKTYKQIAGPEIPDSNLILIELNSNDIENLGGWPLKRSYYALIIENLLNLKVKRVGLEVFLSENISSQKIYNSVLSETIKGKDNVVLGSLIENLEEIDTAYYAEKILFPEPKIEDPDIVTGHLNFYEDQGIVIPLYVRSDQEIEKSFSYSVAAKKTEKKYLKLNALYSWLNFQKFSLLEFFSLLEDNKELKIFADKIVLIGITDPLIAKSVSTDFNEYLPGLALHAFSVDNILNERGINDDYLMLSTISSILLIIILLTIKSGIRYLFGYLTSFLLVSFFIWIYTYVQLNYSAFAIPLILTIIAQISFKFLENRQMLIKKEEESESLRSNLDEKEDYLNQLKLELNKEEKKPSEVLVLKIKNLETEIEKLRKDRIDDTESFSGESARQFEGIVYKSSKMEKIVDLVKKVAPENASVLVLGESGSGKELIAKAIHNLSERKDSNFVAVNCAALPDNLLESELFGHVKGAFTDAINDKIGRFEEADNGTLFLDEIGETSENFQAKLLRVLQSGEFQKVGSSNSQTVDVRIVAATNKNLKNLIKEKKFREDLYYRLNVINIEIPSLSERKEDIPLLADHFVKREDPRLSISNAVINKLMENKWKGNVRELESVIKRGSIFAKSENRHILKLKDLPEGMSKIAKEDFENMILESLREKRFSHSSITETADELGGVGRTVISENFRGMFFEIYTENSFDLEKTIELISASDEQEVRAKVRAKAETYLSNLKKDLNKIESVPLEDIKLRFSSKYKNLPQKYHSYLDQVLKNMIKDSPE